MARPLSTSTRATSVRSTTLPPWASDVAHQRVGNVMPTTLRIAAAVEVVALQARMQRGRRPRRGHAVVAALDRQDRAKQRIGGEAIEKAC